ncbi:Na+(H+)/acetate symporter ActP [Desulfohalotomaculum tongense]|nr:cation acetate symporter [Desulforadius tongensis]MBM7854278.1 Na+(H+)/acetate symporter ActP [Desulforadius tongensis]
MTIAWIPLLFVTALTAVTVILGVYVQKSVKSASDVYVASRSVNVPLNSAAISGEYLSAASFMGIAGMVMKYGYDVLWYPVLYATGYLFLLFFIASPLRRFGAYTIPDFAEGRFNSPLFRKIAVLFVLAIGFFYTMPQMKGAGVALVNILHTPYWVGVVLVGAVVTLNVFMGGMKGITFVQAFQYWVKLVAISLPVVFLLYFVGGYGSAMSQFHSEGENSQQRPRFQQDQMITYNGAGEIKFFQKTTATFTNGAAVIVEHAAKSLKTDRPGKMIIREVAGKEVQMLQFPAGTKFTVMPVQKLPVKLTVYPLRGSENVTVLYSKGQVVPNAPADESWIKPFGPFTAKYGYPLLYTYSLIIAILCGTAGLPHVLVRFYTNPDGKSAKKTAFWVIVLLGAFYFFPPIFGALGRLLSPQLYAVANGSYSTDSVVLVLPNLLNDMVPYLGSVLAGFTAAGAFAGFMTTFSGLLVSLSGALAHDVYGKMINPRANSSQKVKSFRYAAIGAGGTAVLLGTMVESFDINMMVGWAFAIAAASYFPMLIVSVWWRRTTALGAGMGMFLGGSVALLAIVSTMLADRKVLPFLAEWYALHPVARTLAEQPAIWAVPFALAVIVVVSLIDNKVPFNINDKMLALHAPEELGFTDDYIKEDVRAAGVH